MLPLFLSAPTITQILADLETSIRSVTNKVTNTKLTQSLEFHTVLSTMLTTVASNTNVATLNMGGAVICV